jgi:DNA-binding CsgD family transcriptional regulator
MTNHHPGGRMTTTATTPTNDPPLTEKQQQVLDLLAQDKTPTQIAEALNITSQGVHGHMQRLRRRGLIPGEAAPSQGARRNRGSRKAATSAGITPTDAFAEVRASIDAQRQGLTARASELDQEIDDLKAEIDRRRTEKRGVEKAAKDLETFEATLPSVA